VRWRSVTSLGVSKLPRKAPDEVTEHRITFGNYERQFVTEIKNDIEKTAKIAVIGTVAVPVAAVVGAGLLGYGIYKGLNSLGIDNALDAVKDAKEKGEVVVSVAFKLLNKVLNPLSGTEWVPKPWD